MVTLYHSSHKQSSLIHSGDKVHQKDLALASCIQSLLSKNAIERVENVKSLRFYSRLFLVPKPHQKWRPVIDLSRPNAFLLVGINGDGAGGTPLHEALSVSSQGALKISSVIEQSPFFVIDHFSLARAVEKSHKRDEGCRPSPQRPQYPNLYRCLKRRLGHSLRASLYKGSVIRQGKKATYKCSRVEGSISLPEKVQGPVPKPNSVGCCRQLNSSSLHKQTRRNSLG